MKKLYLILAILISGCSLSNIPSRPEKIAIPKLDFHIPKFQKWQLENGLTVFYLENPELPLVEGELMIKVGQIDEAIDEFPAGTAAATGSLLRDGSIQGIAPDQLDKELDNLAISIESSIGQEHGSIAFQSLSEDFPKTFETLAKILTTPAFDRTRLELWKELTIEGLKRRKDDPDTIAGLTFNNALFGESSVYSDRITVESIKRISPTLIAKFYNRFISPTGAVLALTGDIPTAEMKAKINNALSGWKGSAAHHLSTTRGEFQPLQEKPQKPQVYVVNKNFDQATILLGHFGPARLSADQFGISIFNRYFSAGGFGSKLFNEVRTKRGLAYQVDGGFMPGLKLGTFKVLLKTRVEEAPNAIQIVMDEIKNIQTNTPPSPELAQIKDSVEHSFVFNFSTPGSVIKRKSLIQLLGYPEDFDEHYVDNIRNVDADQVEKVAKDRLHPEELIIVMVGRLDAAKVAEYFGASADVHNVDFDIRPRF
jgi:zinc protease